MHACNPVYIHVVYTHENIVNEFFIREEMKAKEKRNYNNILYNGGSGPPLENSIFVDFVTIKISMIRKFMFIAPINSLCYKKLDFVGH